MLEFVIAGLVLGGIYAIASAGLVITYTASGILNFAFGAMAFFIARFYYYLHTEHSWGILPAAVVAIGIAGPAMGIFLYVVLFRYLRFNSPLIKVVATVGLLVAIPALATIIFGSGAILQAPGLAPEPVHVYQFLGRAHHAGRHHRLHLRGGDRRAGRRRSSASPRSASRCGPWSTHRP